MNPLKQQVLWIKFILFLIVLPTVLKAQTNQTVNVGSQTAVVNFPVTTCTYNWTNNNTAIGLAASGTGDIATFTATNTTGTPLTATITATPVGPAPQQPLLYIPNFDANTVSVINASTNTLLTTVPVGTKPYSVTVSHDYNRVYISNQASNDVSVIYMPTNRVLATIPGFSTPGAIAVSPDNQTVYVANSGSNTIAIINALNNTIIATIPVAQTPIGLSLNLDGSKLYVANYNSLTVSVINTATKAVTNTIILNSAPDFTLLSPDGSKLYVVESFLSEILVVNTTTNLVTTFFVPGNTPKGVAISPDGSRLYVANSADGNIVVINTTNNTFIKRINTGTTPTGLSISDDGSLLYVCNSGSNNVSVINTTTLLLTQNINVGARPYSVGNFYLTRADCGAPITFSITVNDASIIPVITTNGTPSAVSTTFGTPSTPVTFMAGASNANDNLVISAPTGFEVSLDNSNYYNVVTMNGPGSIISRTVYVRLKSTSPVGTYSGNIILTSPGATTVNVIMPLSTVTALNPLITATGTPSPVNTTYGTPSLSTSFSVTGTNLTNGILVTPPAGFEISTNNITFSNTLTLGAAGNLASQLIYLRLKATSSVGTYSGNVVLTSPGASDVSVAIPLSTITPAPVVINVEGNKTYGYQFDNFVAGPADVDFSKISSGLKNGESLNSIHVDFTGGNTATSAVATYPQAIIISQAGGINGFLASNYTITYTKGDLIVSPAPLVITANSVNKNFGTALTGGPGSAAFTSTGLQNGETITSVSVNYGAGAAASAATGVYPGSVTPSAVIGGNGFLAGNYSISYVASSLVVAQSEPVINVSGSPSSVNTVYGNPSAQTQFTFSGTNTTEGITVTAPAGFEISAGGLGFTNQTTIGTGGNIPNIIVYVRLKATTPVGTYTGDVVLHSAGATDVKVNIPNSTVSPAPLTITAADTTKAYGTTLQGAAAKTTFTASGLQNGETIGSVSINYNTGAAASDNAGSYAGSVIASLGTGGTFLASNYSITYVAGKLVVTPVPLTVIADNKTKIYDVINPVFTATYQGFVNGDSPSKLTTQPTITTTATLASPVGEYPITATGGASVNYTISYMPGVLTVIPEAPKIIIPNTFTPNGDGVNDYWAITNLDSYPGNKVEIFNRYGKLLATSNDYATPWTGKYNGVDVPMGTYYYVISFTDGKQPISGFVTIIR